MLAELRVMRTLMAVRTGALTIDEAIRELCIDAAQHDAGVRTSPG